MRELIVLLSCRLDPIAASIEEMNFHLRHQLGLLQVPFDWTFVVVTAFWCLTGLMVMRVLDGWLRLSVIAAAALVMAKMFGLFPVA